MCTRVDTNNKHFSFKSFILTPPLWKISGSAPVSALLQYDLEHYVPYTTLLDSLYGVRSLYAVTRVVYYVNIIISFYIYICPCYIDQGRIKDLVIWEYYYYCIICLWKVWCRKFKIDLQAITIIWSEETEPLFSLSLFSFFSVYFFMFIWDFWGFLGGGDLLSAPLWIRQSRLYCSGRPSKYNDLKYNTTNRACKQITPNTRQIVC